jgi:2-polyprenyl-3-methyl-5-hydroxy-6-metoxy-1,4-benzoquinol methylase
LEHFYSPKNELDKILNLLKPNGMILIRTERHLGRDHFSSWYYHKDPTHVIFFSKSTFEFVAKRYNLFITFPDKNIVLLRRSLEA